MDRFAVRKHISSVIDNFFCHHQSETLPKGSWSLQPCVLNPSSEIANDPLDWRLPRTVTLITGRDGKLWGVFITVAAGSLSQSDFQALREETKKYPVPIVVSPSGGDSHMWTAETCHFFFE
eukprot:5662902-Karenia_brevis.AAC.1